METLAQIRARVRDLIDSDTDDEFHTSAQIDAAINDVLIQTADRLCGTVARRRYMTRTADLSALDGSGFDASTLIWTLPANFRRPYKLVRDGEMILGLEKEEDFSVSPADRYLIVGRELWLTEATVTTDLEVWYFYMPARLAADADEPEFVEGYEAYLALRAAARRLIKGEQGDPKALNEEAAMLWADLLIAARASALPSVIRSRDAQGEHWYG